MTGSKREALRRAIDARRRELEADDPRSAVLSNAKKPPWQRKRPRVVNTHNRSGYCNGCRCDICREAHRVYSLERSRRKRAAA